MNDTWLCLLFWTLFFSIAAAFGYLAVVCCMLTKQRLKLDAELRLEKPFVLADYRTADAVVCSVAFTSEGALRDSWVR